MKNLVSIVVLAGLLAAGCKKAPPAAQEAPQPEQAQAQAQPEAAPDLSKPPPPPPPAVAAVAENIIHENVNGEVDAFLTQQLRVFIQQNNRFPQSFAEFARGRLDGVPRPPEGKKWVIDTTSQQVKSVPR